MSNIIVSADIINTSGTAQTVATTTRCSSSRTR